MYIKSIILALVLSFNLNAATETEFTGILIKYEQALKDMEEATSVLDFEFETICKKDYGVEEHLKSGDYVNLLIFYNKDKAKSGTKESFRLGSVKPGDEFNTVYGYPLYELLDADSVTTYIREGTNEAERERRKRLIQDIIQQVEWDAAYNLAVRSCVKVKDGTSSFCRNKTRLRAKNDWLESIKLKKDTKMYLTFKTNTSGHVVRHNKKEAVPIDLSLKMRTASQYDRHNTKKVAKYYEDNSKGTDRNKHFPTRFISFADQKVDVEGKLEKVSKTVLEMYEEGLCDKIIGFPETERYLHVHKEACWGGGEPADRCKSRNDKTMEVGILEASKGFKKVESEDENDKRLRKYYRSSIDLLGEAGNLQENCQNLCSATKSLVSKGMTAAETLLEQLRQLCIDNGKVFAYKPGGNGVSGCYFECDEALFPNDDLGLHKCLCSYYNDGNEGISWNGLTNTCGTCDSTKASYHECVCRQAGGKYNSNKDPKCSFSSSGEDDDDQENVIPEYSEDNTEEAEVSSAAATGDSSDSSTSGTGSDSVSGTDTANTKSADANAGDDSAGKDKAATKSNKYSSSKGSKNLKGFSTLYGDNKGSKKKSTGKPSTKGKASEILPVNADVFQKANVVNCTACGSGNLMGCSTVKNASSTCENIISGGKGFKGTTGTVK